MLDTTTEINECAPSATNPCPQKQTIHKWITSIKSTDTTNLFHKVSTCLDGTVEMWLYKSHQKEAREWSKVALGAIAILSGIDIDNERHLAELLFKDPDRVWEQISDEKREDSIPSQRNAFMQFTPPSNASVQHTAYRKKQQKARPPRKPKLQLHFEMDLVKRTALAEQQPPTATDFPPLQPSIKQTKKKGAKTAPESVVHATSIDPHAAAAAAALKVSQAAMNVGQAAIAKYPPTAEEKLKHGGKFYTMTDVYGNKVPVVYVLNAPQPLTEKSLLESRAQAECSNFAIVPTEEARKPAGIQVVTTSNEKISAEAATPIIKNTKGTPPKNLHRYQGNMFGASSKDTDRQFWTRQPGSMVEDPNPPGYKDPHSPGWAPLGWVPDPSHIAEDMEIASRRAAEDYVAAVAEAEIAHGKAHDDPMDDDCDDDATVVSENLSVGSATKLRLERAAASVAASVSQFFAPEEAAATTAVAQSEPRVLFHAQQTTPTNSTQTSSRGGSGIVLGRGGGRGAGRGSGRAARQTPVSEQAETNASSKYLIELLASMTKDHRADMERLREDNRQETKQLLDQISELQATITELMHRMEQPRKFSPQYDTSMWDDDDEAAAAQSFATPQKTEAPIMVVKRHRSRKDSSTQKMAGNNFRKVLQESARETITIVEGTKKARISQSPETKSMNPYQFLAADIDEDDDDEASAPTDQVFLDLASDDDSAVVVITGNPRDTIDEESDTKSQDQNVSYGTIPDDAASYVDTEDLPSVETEKEAQPADAEAIIAAESSHPAQIVDRTDIECPVTVLPDKELQIRETTAATLQRISEAQNELKRMRVDSPQKTSKNFKPDAGERADTGAET